MYQISDNSSQLTPLPSQVANPYEHWLLFSLQRRREPQRKVTSRLPEINERWGPWDYTGLGPAHHPNCFAAGSRKASAVKLPCWCTNEVPKGKLQGWLNSTGNGQRRRKCYLSISSQWDQWVVEGNILICCLQLLLAWATFPRVGLIRKTSLLLGEGYRPGVRGELLWTVEQGAEVGGGQQPFLPSPPHQSTKPSLQY